MFFFLCFRVARALDLDSALPNKNHVFFSAKRAHWIVLSKNSLFREIKENISKKNKFILKDKKHFSSYIFLLVFVVALNNFLLNRSRVCFYFIAFINFSRNLSNVFFSISSLSLTFPEIGSMFIFLKCFFLPPSLIRFWIFLWSKTGKSNIVALHNRTEMNGVLAIIKVQHTRDTTQCFIAPHRATVLL